MAQWGRNDTAVTANGSTTIETSNGAPIGTYTLVKGDQVNRVDGANAHFGNTSPGTRAYTDYNMFGNTTVGAFMPNKAVGVFAVNTAMMQTAGGNLVIGIVTSGGSGYKANAAVTLTVTNGGTSGVVNAQVSTTNATRGRVTALNIQTGGSGYITAPTVTIAAPDLLIFNGNTNVTPNGSVGAFIAYASANSYLQVNDKVVYAGNATSTPVTLVNNRAYYVSFANSSGFKVSDSAGSANINFAKASGDSSTAGGATFQGETATGYVDTNSVLPQVTHSGWVLRTEGTGGRAGRVQYETLVAMGSLGESDAKYGTPATVTSNTVDQYV
jgi:hypothetical protein